LRKGKKKRGQLTNFNLEEGKKDSPEKRGHTRSLANGQGGGGDSFLAREKPAASLFGGKATIGRGAKKTWEEKITSIVTRAASAIVHSSGKDVGGAKGKEEKNLQILWRGVSDKGGGAAIFLHGRERTSSTN